jgi:very-short-patch-repair endonuclease
VAQLLRDALSATEYQSLMYHTQIKLFQVASPSNQDWTDRERAFMARASCDFVIYFKVGKIPVGVIEVDGSSHDQPDQAARDALKNGVLAKSGVPILRLRTVESRIEERIGDFIAQWSNPAANVSGGTDPHESGRPGEPSP